MVQIIPRAHPSFGEQINTGLQQGLQRGADFGQMILKENLARKSEQAKREALSKAEESNYEKIKEAFGEKFADVWKASPVGARTALETAAIQQGLRQLPIGGLFGESAEGTAIGKQIQGRGNQLSLNGKNFNFPDITKPEGQTPAETVKYQRELRSDNSPIFKENVGKLKGLKDTSQHLKILEDLNHKIPEYSRLLVNKEGNLFASAQKLKAVPKEAERFVKTINDFLTSAKDIFGARVTNYDIAQFKSRLPGLLNSQEGRAEIIKQMQIFNQIEQNYRDALSSVYKHYGLGDIPQEQAEFLAEEMVRDQEEALRAQLLQIGQEETLLEQHGERKSLEDIFG